MDDADRATEIIERMGGQVAERVKYVPPVRGYDDAAAAYLAWLDTLKLPTGEP